MTSSNEWVMGIALDSVINLLAQPVIAKTGAKAKSLLSVNHGSASSRCRLPLNPRNSTRFSSTAVTAVL
jgi:hypothetical protein